MAGGVRRDFCLAICSVLGSTHAALIASSRLEQCFNDGNPNTLLNCNRRITVSLAIAAGQRGTEEIHAVMDGTDASHRDRELETPLRISISKSQAVVRYPVVYFQSFNAAPYEVVTHHGLGGCDDGDLSANPSCGWVLAADGSRIQDSQGFCCSCGADQILGTSSTSTRSTTLECNLFGSAQSAHCLRMNELWYAAYTLGTPQLHFSITVEARQHNGTMAEYTLDLSPQNPGEASPDSKVTARLLGDLASYEQDMRPLGATKYLMTPSQPASHARVQAGVDAWLLVEKTAVSTDGSTCNQIGTSHSAFRHQANKCQSTAGSCLKNQLEDLQAADERRIANGEMPLNRVSGLGSFAPYVDANGAQYVAYVSRTTRNSLVTLTLDADDIRFVVAESSGQVESLVCEDFEALSREGRLVAKVSNTGMITADFSLRVRCSSGIMDGIEARAFSLAPEERRSTTFALYTTHENGTEHVCTAFLYGSRQTMLSALNVSFSTTMRIVKKGAQGGERVAGVGEGRSQLADGSNLASLPCDVVCVGLFDVICFITFGCGTKLATCFAILGVTLVFCCCCCCATRSQFVRQLCCYLLGGRPALSHPPLANQRQAYPPRLHYSMGRVPIRKHYIERGYACGQPGHAGSHTAAESASGFRRATRRLSIGLHSKLASSSSWPPRGGGSRNPRRRAYLNVTGEFAALAATEFSADSWLRSPGRDFSLRGEIVLQSAQAEYFVLSSDCFQYWRWNSTHGQYEPQTHPTKLNRSFFRLPLVDRSGRNLEETQMISTAPHFMVINAHDDRPSPQRQPSTS